MGAEKNIFLEVTFWTSYPLPPPQLQPRSKMCETPKNMFSGITLHDLNPNPNI